MREVWQLLVWNDVMYHITRRLELTRCRLCWWNREVVGDISRRLDETEAVIIKLQRREDQDGELTEADLVKLQKRFILHYFLSNQQEVLWMQQSRI